MALRGAYWPKVTDEELWSRKLYSGYTSIPRTMPQVMNIIDALTKNKPAGRTYFVLWSRTFDESLLVIEPLAARIDGQRIDGREMVVRSERFTLWRVDDRCVLRRESTGERVALPGADCRTP